MAIPFSRVKKKLDLEDTIGFGSYQGKTLHDIIDFHGGDRIIWYCMNVEHFFVTEEVWEYANKHRKPLKTAYRPGIIHDYAMAEAWDEFDDVPF